MLDVVQVLRSLNDSGSTNYAAALQSALDTLTTVGTTAGNGNVIFLSDGNPNAGGEYTDEATALKNAGANVRAFGVGTGATLSNLQKIDPNAAIFTSTNELLNVFSGAGGGSSTSYTEPGLGGVTIYLDVNNNGVLDFGEPSTVSAADGSYSFTNLPSGTYTVREIVPAGYTQTSGPYTVTLGIDPSLNLNIGNQVSSSPNVSPDTISGTKFDDLNGNGVRDSDLIQGSQPDAIFVIDISGSTDSTFQGDPVGDLNGDGQADTILDAEIAGFTALNQQLIDQGFGTTGRVSIVAFDDAAVQLDMDPTTAGTQLATYPGADLDGNGVLDVVQVLRSLNDSGSTNYAAALQSALDTLTTVGTTAGNGNVIFLSDGNPNAGGEYTDEATALKNAGANVRAFGVGTGATLSNLQKIDPNAAIFTSTNELLRACPEF